MAVLGTRTAVPTGSMGYSSGHGARLRSARRSFARSVARNLAETRMEELERTQLGETEREKLEQAGLERAQLGETKRKEMTEAGLKKRLEMEQAYARPEQKAKIGRLGALGELRRAEAGKVRYGTEFEKGLEGSLEDIIRSRAEEAGIGVSEARREIRLRDEGEVEAARISDIEEAPMIEPARPRRELRPSIARPLFGGPPLKRGFEAPPLLAPTGGWGAFKDFLNLGVKEGYEWAFPER